MKQLFETNKTFIITLSVSLITCFLFWMTQAESKTIAERLKGRILLQVESRGEAWYVHPVNLKRYYLGKPTDAFRIMKKLSLGIRNRDLAKIPKKEEIFQGDIKLRHRLSGRILLQVEEAGKAWYVNPVDLKRYYLGRPTDAFKIMRKLGLGITNADLAKIPIAKDSILPTKDCTIKIATGVIVNNVLVPIAEVTMLESVSTRVTVSNFQGSEKDVLWRIENPKIAKVHSPTGSSNTVRGLASGNTRLIITDNAVGPHCNVILPVIITSVHDECTHNADCNDNDLSTRDICAGIPRRCSNIKIVECLHGDHYCPPGCTEKNDNDCKKPEIPPGMVDCGTDMGKALPTKDNPTKALTCIIEKIKTCSPAKYTFINITPGLGGKTTGMIQGISEDRCVMKFKFITHPIREFSGTEMICRPPMAHREAAFGLYFVGLTVEECTGSFVDAFKKVR